MKYLYFYVWVLLFNLLYKGFLIFFTRPMYKFFGFVFNISDKKQKEWEKNFTNVNLDFPGGILDWYAFAFTLWVIFIPIIIFVFKLNMNGIFFGSKTRSIILLCGVAIFAYYWLFHKEIDWLRERIDRVVKNYPD